MSNPLLLTPGNLKHHFRKNDKGFFILISFTRYIHRLKCLNMFSILILACFRSNINI